jgi:hypothetical protein
MSALIPNLAPSQAALIPNPAPSQAALIPNPAPSQAALIPNPAPSLAGRCSACRRDACFQARVDPAAGHEHAARRANACASHLVEVIQMLRAWASSSRLAGGWLTVLAIDPYAVSRLAADGVTDHGFPFYSAPLNRPDVVARREEGCDHG